MTPTRPPPSGHNGSDAGANWFSTDPWIKIGLNTVIWFFIGLMAWSALVSISSAVVTSGTVALETSYQDVQSLEGGVVTAIKVKNGDHVQQGDTLVRLDDTTSRANLVAIFSRVNELRIKEARLETERDDGETLELPDSINARNKNARKVFAAQHALFLARRKARVGTQSVLSQRIVQLAGGLSGLKAQHTAAKKQRAINEGELATVMPLYERGYVSQQRLSPLKRESARLEGEIGRLGAEIHKIESETAEANLRKAQADKQFISEVVEELSTVQASLAEQQQTLKRMSSAFKRTWVRAPRAGLVHGLSVQTIGGVVKPGALLAQIIPEGEQFVVEASLPPQSVDRVRPGLPAAILFSSFNARTTPRLKGSVSKVSPAELKDERGRSYFTARINIPASELAKIGAGHRLVPGMPAEVFIETGSRSVLSYLFKPLADTMTRAFREQ